MFFTPFSFLFLLFYFLFLFIVLYCPDFYSFWVIIECSSLLFMGLSYSFMSFGFSNIMLYFVIQAVSSVNIFVFYSLSIDSLIIIFLFLKLAVFPFFGWFMLVISNLNNCLFFFISTFQKLPSVVLFYSFVSFYYSSFFVIALSLTIFVSSLFMFSSFSFRFLLSFSSVGSNAWFILSSMCGIDFFYIFFVVYVTNFYFLMCFLDSGFKLLSSMSSSRLVYFFSCLISIGGFPPFPPFFMKLYIVYCLSLYSFFSFPVVVVLLLSVVYMLASYMRFSLSYFINLFSSSLIFVV